MRELNDETLGWFSRPLRWGTYGMLARASLPSPDLGIALDRWFRHHLLLTDDLVLTLESGTGRCTVALDERVSFGGMREFCLLSYLRFIHGYACWAIDSLIPLLDVGFPFDAPDHCEVYDLLFPGSVRFNTDRAFFSFDRKYLGLPHKRDDVALRTMLQRPLPLTVLQYRRERLLVKRIRMLLADGNNGATSAEAVARKFHLSTRRLFRQLREEGTSLQRLKDESRREQAVHLLCRTERPIKQIASQVGFSDAKSFTRAFKHWTGVSPREYRQRSRMAESAD